MAEAAWAITSDRQGAFLWTIKRTRSEAIRAFFSGLGDKFETDADLMRAWRRNRYRWPDRRARRIRIEVIKEPSDG